MRSAIRLITVILPLAGLLGLPHTSDAHMAQVETSGFVRCKGSGDVVEVRRVSCDLGKKVVLGIYYDGKGRQVGPTRTDYLGFKCHWPNEDGYSMTCRHKRFTKKRINFYSD